MGVDKKLTKEFVIAEFKKLCADGITLFQRKEAVATQQSRNYWEINVQHIVISIAHTNDKFELRVYEARGHIFANNRVQDLIAKFYISKEEYFDLKKHYFGEFTIDAYYMEKVAAVTQSFKNIKKLEADYEKTNT